MFSPPWAVRWLLWRKERAERGAERTAGTCIVGAIYIANKTRQAIGIAIWRYVQHVLYVLVRTYAHPSSLRKQFSHSTSRTRGSRAMLTIIPKYVFALASSLRELVLSSNALA